MVTRPPTLTGMRFLALLISGVVLLAACTSSGASPQATAPASLASPGPVSLAPSIAPSAPPASTPGPGSATPAAASSPVATPAALSPVATPPATPLATTISSSPPSAEPETPTTATWTKLRPDAGPGPREDHTWTVDEAGEVAYLFGGRMGGKLYGDLWAYDLAADTWSTVPFTGGPSARFGHEAVWVPGRGLLIFAGQAGSNFFNELWLYDPGTGWRQLSDDGDAPARRYGSCAALGPDGRLWISHGFTEDGVRFADTRVYDFASGAWADETPTNGRLPVERCLHGCWFDATGAFVLYAGQTTGVTALGDLWSLAAPGDDASAWRSIEGDLPPTRNLYAHAWWNSDRLVFGGKSQDGSYRDDLWAFDLVSLQSRLIRVTGAPPPGRAGAVLLADPIRGRLLLFGGKRAGGTFEDLWQLTLA